MPCWQSGWRELQSPGVPWLPDGRGNNLQSFHSPGWVKTSSNPVPTGNGLYSMSAFFASAKTLSSILRSCLWSLFQKGEEKKKEDADLGHRGYEGLLKTRWQDREIWCPYLNCCQVAILIRDRLLWNESCCFFMVCKQFIVTVQVSVTISESPQRYYYPFERFLSLLCCSEKASSFKGLFKFILLIFSMFCGARL